jgi:type IV pilus assembly protein PilQ
LVALLLLAGLAPSAEGQTGDAVRLTEVTVEPQRDATAVQITTTGAARYRAALAEAPPRLVLEFADTTFAWRRSPLSVSSDPVKRITGSQPRRNLTRIVIELTRKSEYTVEETPTGLRVLLPGTPELVAKAEAAGAAPAAPPSRPAVVAQAPGTPGVVRSDGRRLISLDFKDADVVNLLRILAAESGRNIVIGDDVKGRMSITLRNVPWEVALETILEARGLQKIERDNLIRIVTNEQFVREREARVRAEETRLRIEEAKAKADDARVKAEEARLRAEAEARQRAMLPPGAPGATVTPPEETDFDVVTLLRRLAAEGGKNIVMADDVRGRVTISLKGLPWDVAMDTVLEAKGLAKVERNNILRIVTLEQLAREREARARAEEARIKAENDARQKEAEIRQKQAEAAIREQEIAIRQAVAEAAAREAEARGPLREETVRLSYADPEEVMRTLQGILGIPPQGIPVSPTIPTGMPPIAEPPFSQLYGTTPAPRPPVIIPPPPDILARGITIQAHKPTNSIFIRHYATDLERIKRLIRETLDIPLPQVKIEARLESLDRFALENLGINWGGAGAFPVGNAAVVGQGLTTPIPAVAGGQTIGPPAGIPIATPLSGVANTALTLAQLLPIAAATGLPTGGSLVNLPVSTLPTTGGISPTPTGGIAFGIVGTRFNINIALQALAEQQKTRTIARPEVVTVENSRAMIQLGREIPYATVSSAGTQVQFRDAVLQLQVTPVVIREGNVNKIKMSVLVENNEQGADTAAGPTIVKRRAETQVLVREGEHLVIGGVGNSTEAKTVRKVPVFGDVPILGWLFKQRGDREQSSELVVFITPTVLASAAPSRR